MRTISKGLHNKYAKTIIPIALVVGLVFGFFFGLGFMLNTSTPVMVVESGSMCLPYGSACDGWLSVTHVFAPTLHKGDLIIIQGVDPETLNINYPNSDVIVYKKPTNLTATPVVHRIVTSYKENGTLYFQTKGDGNGQKWPAVPSATEYDTNTVYFGDGQGVPENLVIGKVIMRIPYFGWITLVMRDNQWVLAVIIVLILLLIVLEFIVPEVKRKKIHPSVKKYAEVV